MKVKTVEDWENLKKIYNDKTKWSNTSTVETRVSTDCIKRLRGLGSYKSRVLPER